MKYVDDTTILQTVCPGDNDESSLQSGIEHLNNWAKDNMMRFNATKTKEMVFDFRRINQPPSKLTMDGVMIERVTEAKILGVTLQSDLKWNSHIASVIKKANKRLHLLKLCKRAGLKSSQLITMYTTLVRSVLEYCCTVFHTSLPQYLHNDLERIQKRALSIIFPDLDY